MGTVICGLLLPPLTFTVWHCLRGTQDLLGPGPERRTQTEVMAVLQQTVIVLTVFKEQKAQVPPGPQGKRRVDLEERGQGAGWVAAFTVVSMEAMTEAVRGLGLAGVI